MLPTVSLEEAQANLAEIINALGPGEEVTGLPPKGGSLPLKLDSPIEGSSSL